MRRLAVVLLAGTAALAAVGRTADAKVVLPDPVPLEVHEEIDRLLDSTRPSDVAWGARLAADHRDLEAVPLLVARLKAETRLDEARRTLALDLALLDAVVVLDPPLDPEDLLPLANDWNCRGAVLVLVARRSTARPDVALDLFTRLYEGTRAWLAIGNVLASHRTPGFAAEVLRRLLLRQRVRAWSVLPHGPYREPTGAVPG